MTTKNKEPRLLRIGRNRLQFEGTPVIIDKRPAFTVCLRGKSMISVRTLAQAKEYARVFLGQTKG